MKVGDSITKATFQILAEGEFDRSKKHQPVLKQKKWGDFKNAPYCLELRIAGSMKKINYI